MPRPRKERMETDRGYIVKTTWEGFKNAPRYKDPDAFVAKAERYIDECKEVKKPVTISGLCLYMGLAGRKRLNEYAQFAGFDMAVDWLKLLIENGYEEQLAAGVNTNGAIFALKQFGWHDKQDVHHSGEGATPRKVEYVIKKAK